ncbi:hypothetical protein ONZ43_g1246 [Nemania bipapillata]|uniref:Uncharacterized protein n=1 Tax=Nemania bipapillata TaxID=110536 RepID=A0ACC2J527_9PEZI|nr:hypothetical protein ONZ43_g1246 [Nemania bipapillata]
MRFITLLCLALGSAGLTSAATIAYVDGYVPTVEQVAEDEIKAKKASNPELLARSSATGCVQVHCGYNGDSLVGDVIQLEVYQDGKYIFYLSAGQHGWSDNTEKEWVGIRDYRNRQWGFKIKGLCGNFQYLNDFQTEYGWYTLVLIDYASDTYPCGLTCILKETIYSDSASGKCYGYHGLSMCDFRGRCDTITGDVRQCSPPSNCG